VIDLFTCDLPDHADRPATRFEERPDHWHDSTWCDECAEGRTTVPIGEENARAADAFAAMVADFSELDARYPDVGALLETI